MYKIDYLFYLLKIYVNYLNHLLENTFLLSKYKPFYHEVLFGYIFYFQL